jgi:hypothetical protein
MKYFDEYVRFVVDAKIVGCEIENKCKFESYSHWSVCDILSWNWSFDNYRIKLPDGWEYVMEDGEIAFREPKKGERYLIPIAIAYVVQLCKGTFKHEEKFPIVKRSEKK